ncbi:MAG: 30S ribosomal protein S2 [Elusimicrobium sp.]|uniref:Small ribosomal subunit protein uS2 n=1 Tax=Candidatus Avelusimicrobium gallicola TaxID=2562704 RepID=A0A928HGH0_9BACT|nr:30S ribosomal protein S2 [Elusimicrobium sp.]
MSNVSMKAMLEAGVHFGHQTSRWNPKMGRFIFGERNGVHILDLQKTAKELKKACAFIKEESKKGSKFLFVGTKKQAQEAIQAEAARCGAYCIHEKWLGGTLTNFQTVKKSVERLNELEKWEASGVFKAISKKEASRLGKEMLRLQKLLGGIRDMKVLPDVVFVIDPVDTAGAVRESYALGIPVVAVCDTNADPDMISVPVPGNDDAARSIKLFCAAIADSILEGKAELEAVKTAEAAPADNPVMAQAFETAMLAAEKAEEAKEEVAAEEVKAEEVKAEEPAKEEVVVEEVKEEVVAEEVKAEEKPAKKPAAKKRTTTKKTTATKTKKTVKAKAEKAEEVTEEKAEEAK